MSGKRFRKRSRRQTAGGGSAGLEWADLPSRRSNPDSQTVDPAEFGIGGVLQFGRCCARTARGSAYGIHAHDCYQLTICTSGTMTFTGADGEMWTLLPGRMLFLPPQTLHRLSSNSRGVMRYWLFLPKTFGDGCVVDGLPEDESAWLAGMIRRLTTGVYSMPEPVTKLLGRMFGVLEGSSYRKTEKSLRLRSMMLDLLIAIADAKRCAESDGGMVGPVVGMMAKSPERAYPMDWLVERTGLSPTTVINKFQRETGKTPHQYLIECRIRKAAAILRRTSKSVTDIAHSLGFASSQHFAMCFRREIGKTPRQWRGEMVKK